MKGGKEWQNNPPSSNKGEIKDISKSKLKQKDKIHKKEKGSTKSKAKNKDEIHKSKRKRKTKYTNPKTNEEKKVKDIIMFKHENQTSKSTDTGKT